MQSNSLSVLRIDVGNIVKNYIYIKNLVGKNVSVSAVVKANCYALGAIDIAPSLNEAGCKEFYVATLDEGIELRSVLPVATIFILSGINRGEEYYFLKYNLVPVLNNDYQIDIWLGCTEKIADKLDACLHVDIGMSRLGISMEQFVHSIEKMTDYINIIYVIGHLSVSEEKNNSFNNAQLHLFQQLQNAFPQFKYSLSNSGGIVLGKEYHFNQVRPGIGLHGVDIGKNEKENQVVTLTSEIINIFFHNKDVPVGYGCTYIAKLGTITGVVPIGYADGYPYHLGNIGYCFINGIKVPIIGRVNMDYICLDITNVPQGMRRIGQSVEIIGKNIDVATLAKLSSVPSHNILTSLGSRYKREYIK